MSNRLACRPGRAYVDDESPADHDERRDGDDVDITPA